MPFTADKILRSLDLQPQSVAVGFNNMQNTENDPLSLPFANKDPIVVENKLWVAVTVTAVVLAGSALAYRHATAYSGSARRLLSNDAPLLKEKEKIDEDSVHPAGISSLATSDVNDQESEYGGSNGPKSSRSKDRRKRGKDPLREVLKSTKKLKSFPIPAGSPQPPTPVLSANFGTSNQPGDDTELYPAFEPGSSLDSLDAYQTSHESQRSPTHRLQREKFSTSLATLAVHLSETDNSREPSETSHSTHDAEDDLAYEDDADSQSTSSYRQSTRPNSITQSSLPRPPSSLADISETDPEGDGWITSASKFRSRRRSPVPDSGDSNASIGLQGRNEAEDRTEDVEVVKRKGKTKNLTERVDGVAESYSDDTPVAVKEIYAFPQSMQVDQMEASASFRRATSSQNANAKRDSFNNGQENNEKSRRSQVKDEAVVNHTSYSPSVIGGKRGAKSLVVGQESVTAAVAPEIESAPGSSFTQAGGVSGVSSKDRTGTENGELEFVFPTLNPLSSPSFGGPSSRTRPIQNNSLNVSSTSPLKKNRKFSHKSGTPSPNAPPSRTSSPSSIRDNTSSSSQGPSTPALSAQTQLASLKGALEASRLREEKHKVDMEKMTKEMENLKWENSNSHKGQAELQAHVRHLTHQLQSYATFFSSRAPHLQSVEPAQVQSNGLPTKDDTNTSEGASPTPNPEVELSNEGEENGGEEEPALSSDKSSDISNVDSVSSTPPPLAIPPFFPYSPPYTPTQHPHFHHSPWLYQQYPSQPSPQNTASTSSPSHYTNLYSPMMYPVAPPFSPQSITMIPQHLLHQSYGFGPGLRGAGVSAAGSPEMLGPAPGVLNKQKSRMRKRKLQMTNSNGSAKPGWEDVGDGWVGLSRVAVNVDQGRRASEESVVGEGDGDNEDVEPSSSPYSELLADAILKRSSTIRPSKKGSKKRSDADDRQDCVEEVEPFTFPSLSDLYYHTSSRTESSISSSLSSSPPSTAPTDLTGEDDKTASLLPVVEKTECSDSALVVVQDTEIQTSIIESSDCSDVAYELATPTKKEEDHEEDFSERQRQ